MQQLNWVSLLLLLFFMVAALSSFVATAHRELPMARKVDEIGDHLQAKLDNQASSVSVTRATAKAEHDHQEAVMRKCKNGRKNCKNFRTRELPADADGKIHFDGHMPFTADYHSVRRHPPSHN
uniref:Uncharacterized protein n=1 Tax=Oryza glumipatula TaxID=40148 RepID=A0A0D9YNK2_9ORYZ